MKKKKFQIAFSTIIITAGVSYLMQYWLKQSGMQDRILNTYDIVKDTFKGDKQ
jgi:phosphoserine phosphatase